MKKKILHIMTGLSRGGCETNALSLVSQAKENEHAVLVLGRDAEMESEFVRAGATVTFHEVRSRWPWRLSQGIRQACKKIAADAVVCWHGMVMLPQILHALRDCRLPVIVHGGNPAHSMPKWVDWRYFMLEKCLGKKASAVYACCSQYVADSFQASLYLRRFPVKVIPNGVKPFTGPVREVMSIEMNSAYKIGMVARLDAIKDHATLLRAFAILQNAYPEVHLEIVGNGDLKRELETQATQLGLNPSTIFLGQVSDVYTLISRWDIFCYATTSQEGLGNALIEAMMVGLPCVATEVGPIQEIAGSPPAVLLVRCADPQALAAGLSSLLQDREMRRDFAERGQRRARQKFSQAAFASGYLELMFPRSSHHHV